MGYCYIIEHANLIMQFVAILSV